MKLLTFSLALLVGSMACTNEKNEKSNTEAGTVMTNNIAQETNGIIGSYMKIKDALVNTDPEAAKPHAEELKSALGTNNMSSEMIDAANAIAISDDVEVQRAQFKKITDGLITSLKNNGAEDGVYVQFCPMAFNNSGANWLSLSEEIRNPYFGNKMLKCGKVTEEL